MSTHTGPAVPLQVAWDEAMLAYDFGLQHPMNPERLHLTARLLGDSGLLDLDGVRVVAPSVASDEDLATHKAYAAFGTKKLYGKEVEGVLRSTFVIDEDGKVELAQYNVKATGHVAKLRRDLGLAS